MGPRTTPTSCTICLKTFGLSSSPEITLESQLSVVYFLQKFFPPLTLADELLDAEGDKQRYVDKKPGDQLPLEKLLVKHGSPSNWLRFCPPCAKQVEEARRIYCSIHKLENKLGVLRSKVHNSIAASAGDRKSKTVNVEVAAVRNAILRNDAVDSSEFVKVKMEWPSDVEDFMEEENEEDFANLMIFPGADAEELDSFGETFENHGSPDGENDSVSDSDVEYTPSKSVKTSPLANLTRHSWQPKSSVEERTCPECSQVFDKPSIMKRHYASRHGQDYEEAYPNVVTTSRKSPIEDRTCPKCQKVFEKPSKMKLHYQARHTNKETKKKVVKTKKPLNCSHCNKMFSTKLCLEAHDAFCTKRVQDENQPILASNYVSGKPKSQDSSRKDPCTGSVDKDFELHSDSDSEEDCMQGEQLDSFGENFENHWSPDSHNEADLDSDVEYKASNVRKSSKSSPHVKLVTGSGPLKSPVEERTCPECSQVFDKPSRMKRHYASRHGQAYEEVYPNVIPSSRKSPIEDRTCPKCQKVFEKPSKMKLHYQARHINKEKKKVAKTERVEDNDEPVLVSNDIFGKTESQDSDVENDPFKGSDDEDFELHSDSDSDEDYMPSSKKKKRRSNSTPTGGNKSSSVYRGGPRKTPVEERTCPECHLVFEKPSRMKRHFSVYHKDKALDEAKTTYEPSDTQNLSSSILPSFNPQSESRPKAGPRKTPEEERTCSECAVVFDKPSLMKRHYNSVHVKKVVAACEDCGQEFIRAGCLKKHKWTCPNRAKRIKSKKKKRKTLSAENDDSNSSLVENSNNSNSGSSSGSEDEDTNSSDAEDSNQNGSKWRRKSPSKLRTCPICFKVCDRPSILIRHLQSKSACVTNNGADAEVVITCPVCAEIFHTKEEFCEHYASHNIGGEEGTSIWCRKSHISDRTCPHASCNGRVFLNPSKLKYHISIAHTKGTNPRLECPVCFRTFATKAYLRDHSFQHLSHEERLEWLKKKNIETRTCPVCSELFLTPSKMQSHLNIRHEKVPVKLCEVCKKGFYRKDRYLEHIRSHLNFEQREKLLAGEEITVKLPQLDQETESSRPLAVEEVTPNAEQDSASEVLTLKLQTTQKYQSVSHRTCHICSKVFATRSKKNVHVQTVHERSRSVVCHICGVTMTCPSTLRRHMQIQHEENPNAKRHPCEQCNQIFKHQYSLIRHNLMKHNINTDMRKFACPFCEKAYPFKSLLNQHQRAKGHLPESERNKEGQDHHEEVEQEEEGSSTSSNQGHDQNPQIQYSHTLPLPGYSGYVNYPNFRV